MSRQFTWLSCVAAMIYLLLFAAVSVSFHDRLPLETYYLALAQTMHDSGFSFIANWQQIPLIHLPPLWVWFSEINHSIKANNLALLRVWSGLMTLWTLYVMQRLTLVVTPETTQRTMQSMRVYLPLCALIILALTPTTAWFSLSATPWPTVTAAILTGVYASLAYNLTSQFKYYCAYWVSIWLVTLAAGLLFALPLVFIPLCWPNRAITKHLLTSVRGWVIWVLLYGAWVYAAYDAAGLIVFSQINWLWWLIPSHGALSAYNPFLPSALALPTTMPVWLTAIVLLPSLMLLPFAGRWWQQTSTPQRYWFILLALSFIYVVCICLSQDVLSALICMQIVAPFLAVITAPCLALLFASKNRYHSAFTHFSALIVGIVLVLAIATPYYRDILPIINPALRLALIVAIVALYVPLLVARWVNLHIATIIWILLFALGLLGFVIVHDDYQQQQSLAPLFNLVNTGASPEDVVANVGQLRPELWLAMQRRIVQISPLAAQISVPANPLLVDQQQFTLAMRNNDRRAWIFISVTDIPNYILLLDSYELKAKIGNVMLFGQREFPVGTTVLPQPI